MTVVPCLRSQMRVVKQRLLEMLPEVHCFLDVDDLEDISGLETYIQRSHTVLIFCSRGYFESKNVSRAFEPTVLKRPYPP